MDGQSQSASEDAELMSDDIVGKILSKDVMCEFCQTANPECSRLRQFAHHEEAIHNPQVIGHGQHGVAILAVIAGARYVFKVFKKWKQPGPKPRLPYEQALYITPLAKESRAFARLKDINEDGTWAVKCFGWMKLSNEQFSVIQASTSHQDLSRWVIVKEYEPEDTNASHLPHIHEKFDIAKRARLLPEGARIENYKGTRIIDLSETSTYPCPEWDEFGFKWFYEKTVDGVLNWFPDHSSCESSTHGQSICNTPSPPLAGTFFAILCGYFAFGRVWRRLS